MWQLSTLHADHFLGDYMGQSLTIFVAVLLQVKVSFLSLRGTMIANVTRILAKLTTMELYSIKCHPKT